MAAPPRRPLQRRDLLPGPESPGGGRILPTSIKGHTGSSLQSGGRMAGQTWIFDSSGVKVTSKVSIRAFLCFFLRKRASETDEVYLSSSRSTLLGWFTTGVSSSRSVGRIQTAGGSNMAPGAGLEISKDRPLVPLPAKMGINPPTDAKIIQPASQTLKSFLWKMPCSLFSQESGRGRSR